MEDNKRRKIDEGGSGGGDERPKCEYGIRCYRRNLQHLKEYSHELLDKIYEGMKIVGNFGEIPKDLVAAFDKCGMERKTVLEQIGILRDGDKGDDNTEKGQGTSRQLMDIREERKRKYLESKGKVPTAAPSAEVHNAKTLSAAKLSMQEKWEKSCPYNFFLTKVSSITVEAEGVFSASFADLFHPSLGEVKAAVHFNYMIDPEWFIEQMNIAGLEGKTMRIIFNGQSKDLEGMSAAFPNIKVFGVKSPFPYGHHHTKMSVVQYADLSLRFFVYTANLIESDWENRTQGIWISPKCPRVEDSEERTGCDSQTNFRADIIQYLNTYPLQATRAWIDVIRTVDCSSIKVYFVGSAPVTLQSGSNGFQWGTCKMKKVLKSLKNCETDSSWPLVIQCSSIGTLGHGTEDWVKSELGSAFAGKDHLQNGPIHVVYPSHSNVKASFEGLHGGGCLPYSGATHTKQLWLEKHFCQWKADTSGRSKAVPHIKSYFRISPDNSKLAWFLLTSANLSKAAWGKMNKKCDRLAVMSFEAGVLFVPEILNCETHFTIKSPSSSPPFPLHIDIPLTKYEKTDKPWFFETLQTLLLQQSHS